MTDSSRTWTAPMIAVLSFMALAALYLGAVGTRTGQYADHQVMRGVSGRFGIDAPTAGLLGRYQLPALLIGAGLVALLALARRSIPHLVAAVVIPVATVAVAYFLKAALVRPAFGVGPILNSFPSNTVAVAAALIIVAVSTAPGRLRPVAIAGGGALGALVSVAVIAQQWHRPSDVLGAWLVALCVASVARVVHDAWGWTSQVNVVRT